MELPQSPAVAYRATAWAQMMKWMLVVLVNGITPVNTNLVFDEFADCLAAEEQMRRHYVDAFDAWDRGPAMNIPQRRQYVRERELQAKRLLSNTGLASPTVTVISSETSGAAAHDHTASAASDTARLADTSAGSPNLIALFFRNRTIG